MLSLGLNILSILGFIIGLFSWIDSDQHRKIFYDYKTEVVWRQTRVFSLKLLGPDDNNLNHYTNISKTLVTIWNGGKNVVKPDDVRVPLRIVFEDETLLEHYFITRISVVPNNFELTKVSKNEFELRWKVFDPGMAVQIAFLHNGSAPAFSLSTTLGPQTTVSKRNGFGTTTNIGIIFGIIAGLYAAIRLMNYLMPRITSQESKFQRSPLWVGVSSIYGIVILATIVWGGIFVGSTYVGILLGDTQSPIPLELDY